jgi:hypothetical protein
MKNLFFIFLTPLFYCCTDQSNPDINEFKVVQNSIEINTDSLISDAENIDSSLIITKNDLTDFELKGKVKSISIHSQQIDEEGERMGMGGFYESYDFNELGFISTLEMHGCCGYDPEYVNYKYNDKNQLTHRIFLREDEKDYYNKEKYFYDTNGVLVKVKIAGFDQVLNEEISFKYYEKGLIRKKEILNVVKDKKETVKYTYSDFKNTETYLDDNGDFDYKVVFIFDENRNLIEREMHFSDGKIQQQKFTYKYDSENNWITKIDRYRYILEDGTKEEWRNSTETTRGITYY